MQVQVAMSTLSDKVSPVLDFDRTNAIVVRNLIDNPKESDGVYGASTQTITFTGDVSAATLAARDLVEFDDAGTNRNVSVVDFNTATKKLRVRGQHAGKLLTTSTFTDTVLNGAGVRSIVAAGDNSYIPETSNSGSVFSKWISRLFLFENASDGIEMKLACILYNVEDVTCYYRPKPLGYDGELSDINWIPFNGTGLANESEKIKPRSASNVDPRGLKAGEWQSLTWSVQDLPSFDGLQIKIVMTADNPAHAPLIDDMQLVTSE